MLTRNTRIFISSGTEIDGSGRSTNRTVLVPGTTEIAFIRYSFFVNVASVRDSHSQCVARTENHEHQTAFKRPALVGQTVPWPARSLLLCWNWSQTWQHVVLLSSHSPSRCSHRCA